MNPPISPTTMSTIRIWTNGEEWISAGPTWKDLQDAYRTFYSDTPEEMTGDDEERDNWSMMAPNDLLYVGYFDRPTQYDADEQFRVEEAPAESYWSYRVVATAKAWCELRPNEIIATVNV